VLLERARAFLLLRLLFLIFSLQTVMNSPPSPPLPRLFPRLSASRRATMRDSIGKRENSPPFRQFLFVLKPCTLIQKKSPKDSPFPTTLSDPLFSPPGFPSRPSVGDFTVLERLLNQLIISGDSSVPPSFLAPRRRSSIPPHRFSPPNPLCLVSPPPEQAPIPLFHHLPCAC